MEYLNQFSEEDQYFFKRQIEEWKDEYYGAVYLTEIGDVTYIWRGLTKAEYQKANDYYEDEYEKNEFVCRKCILHPEIEDFSSEIYAGVPETLTQEILGKSGFTLTEKEFDMKVFEYDQQLRTFDNQISCIIKEAFPEFTIEEIEDWQFEKMLWYYARAKWILEHLRGVVLQKMDEADGAPGL